MYFTSPCPFFLWRRPSFNIYHSISVMVSSTSSIPLIVSCIADYNSNLMINFRVIPGVHSCAGHLIISSSGSWVALWAGVSNVHILIYPACTRMYLNMWLGSKTLWINILTKCVRFCWRRVSSTNHVYYLSYTVFHWQASLDEDGSLLFGRIFYIGPFYNRQYVNSSMDPIIPIFLMSVRLYCVTTVTRLGGA